MIFAFRSDPSNFGLIIERASSEYFLVLLFQNALYRIFDTYFLKLHYAENTLILMLIILC